LLGASALLALAGCGGAGGANVASGSPPIVVAQPGDVPPLTGRVMDQANVLSEAEEARLADVAATLERHTSDQLVVVSLPDLGGRDIAEVGLRFGRAWGIGQRGQAMGC
jgi:uncharacterized protein